MQHWGFRKQWWMDGMHTTPKDDELKCTLLNRTSSWAFLTTLTWSDSPNFVCRDFISIFANAEAWVTRTPREIAMMKINHETLALRHATTITDNGNHPNGSRATSKRAAVSVDLEQTQALRNQRWAIQASQSYGMTAGTARRVKEGGDNSSRKGRARREVAKTTGKSSQRRASR